jgi:Ran GTPase-activating protein (RanGAP) involved in mRNA processing and transport
MFSNKRANPGNESDSKRLKLDEDEVRLPSDTEKSEFHPIAIEEDGMTYYFPTSQYHQPLPLRPEPEPFLFPIPQLIPRPQPFPFPIPQLIPQPEPLPSPIPQKPSLETVKKEYDEKMEALLQKPKKLPLNKVIIIPERVKAAGLVDLSQIRDKITPLNFPMLIPQLGQVTNLRSLNFHGKSIGTQFHRDSADLTDAIEGLKGFSQFLEKTTSLEVLQLSKCRLMDPDLGLLIPSLGGSLTKLDISHNRMGYDFNEKSTAALAAFLQNNLTLLWLNVAYNSIGKNVWSVAESLSQNNTLTYLNLGSNNIPAKSAKFFKNMLRSALAYLILSFNKLATLGLKDIGDGIKANESLTTLDLSANGITDDGIIALGNGLSQNIILTTLILSKNKIQLDKPATIVSLLYSSTLTYLDLSENKFSDDGVKALAAALKWNGALMSLILSKNQINEASGRALAESLEKNGTLTSLDLQENNIGNIAAIAFALMLQTNTALLLLNFYSNNIGNAGAEAISNSLGSNSTLTDLRLAMNPIDIEGLQSLASAVNPVINQSLRRLCFFVDFENRTGAFIAALPPNHLLTSVTLPPRQYNPMENNKAAEKVLIGNNHFFRNREISLSGLCQKVIQDESPILRF